MLTQAMKDAGTVYIALHLEVVDDQGTEDLSDDIYESVWADGPDFAGIKLGYLLRVRTWV